MDGTGATALAAVIADATLSVDAFSEHGFARGNNRDIDLARAFYVVQLMETGFWHRQEEAIGIVVETFVAAEHADQFVDLVVIGFDIVIADGPVIAEAVGVLALEIQGPEAQGYATPVIGSAAEHAAAPPPEICVALLRVGLPIQFPATDAGVVITEGTTRGAGAPAWRFPGIS